MDKYYIKYLKYKNKYINLSDKLKQYGGTYNDYRDIMELTNYNFKERLNINIESLIDFLNSEAGENSLYDEDFKFETIDKYIKENELNYQQKIDELTLTKYENIESDTGIIFHYYYLAHIIEKYIQSVQILSCSSYEDFIDIYSILTAKELPTTDILQKLSFKVYDDINYNQLLFLRYICKIYFETKSSPVIDNFKQNLLFCLYLQDYDNLSLFLNNDSIITYIYNNDEIVLFINSYYNQLFEPTKFNSKKFNDIKKSINQLLIIIRIINSKFNILCSLEDYKNIILNKNINNLLILYNNDKKNQKINNIIYKLILDFSKELNYDNIIELNKNICIIAYENNVDILFFDIFSREGSRMINDLLYCNDGYHNKNNCYFSNIHMFIEGNTMTEYNKNILCSNIGLNDKQLQEKNDYINEMLYIILTPSDKLFHSGDIFNIIGLNTIKGTKYYNYEFIERNNEHILWWLYTYVGQTEYKGGWFTLNQYSSGPAYFNDFGYCLKYNINNPFPILFIPPVYLYKYKYNKETYFDSMKPRCSEIITSLYPWAGSHLFEGVKNWQKKGYDKILKINKDGEEKQTGVCDKYADDFARKIIELGFNGYISCDECEVFLNYNYQQKYLSTPPLFLIVDSKYVKETLIRLITTDEDAIYDRAILIQVEHLKDKITKLINDISLIYNEKDKQITTQANRYINMKKSTEFVKTINQIIAQGDDAEINKIFISLN
jgi:hypothetical protein